MPNIRIITYGYKASFLNYIAKQDVRSIAAKLLAEVADLRCGEKVSTYQTVFCCLPPCSTSSAYLLHKAITQTNAIGLPQPGRYSREKGRLVYHAKCMK